MFVDTFETPNTSWKKYARRAKAKNGAFTTVETAVQSEFYQEYRAE